MNRCVGVTVIHFDFAEELAGEQLLARRVRAVRQLERFAELLFGTLQTTAPARQQTHREQRDGLTLLVPGLSRDLQRLREVLFGEIPLAEAITNEAEVLIVATHSRVETGALVEAQRLLEEPRGLAPFPEVLVDESEIVERGDQTIDVVDATERRGCVLQPVDGFMRASQSGSHKDRA